VVLTTPLIEVLKTNFPDCTIHFVCLPVCAELLKPDKRIEKIISFDKRGADSGWHGVYAFAKRLAAETYDGAIVPHRSARTAIIIKLSGVPKTITFDKSTLSLLYTNRVAYQPFIHEVERNLSLLQPLGISSHYVPPKLFASDAAVASVGKMLATVGKKPYAVIAPASTWATNMWTAEGFASLAQNLAAKNFAVILIGSKDDVALCNRIAGASSSVLNLAGKTTLSEAVEVLRGATFAVTNDSGPLHLAQAVDCRTRGSEAERRFMIRRPRTEEIGGREERIEAIARLWLHTERDRLHGRNCHRWLAVGGGVGAGLVRGSRLAKDDDRGDDRDGRGPGIGHGGNTDFREQGVDPLKDKLTDRRAEKFGTLAPVEFPQKVVEVTLRGLLIALEADDPVHRFVAHGAQWGF
jgi:heptosyltransferase-2